MKSPLGFLKRSLSFADGVPSVVYGGRAESGVIVNESTAERLLPVFSCVNVLAQSLAQMPLRLMRRNPDGGESVATSHPLHKLVSRKPNPDMTSYVFRAAMEGHRQGWGNCYAEIVRDGGTPTALRLITPQEIGLRRMADGTYLYDYNPVHGKSRVLTQLDVLHVPFFSHDGIVGRSPISIACDAIGLGLAIQSSGSSFFRNGATVKGVIESEYPPNALSNYADKFKENFAGAQSANQTPILPKGMTYKAVSIPPDDAQAVETLKLTRTQIAGLYRVPPHLIGDLEKSTFTNAQEMSRVFAVYTLEPNVRAWEDELNDKLLTTRERDLGYSFDFDMNAMLRGSTKERYDAHHVALQDGWLSRNEVRERERLPRVDGLDDYLVSTGMAGENDAGTQDGTDDGREGEGGARQGRILRGIEGGLAAQRRDAGGAAGVPHGGVPQGTGKRIGGYGVTFGTHPHDLLGFSETYERGVFEKADLSRCVAVRNHDDSLLFGSYANGTLDLEIDEKGLKYSVALPETPAAQDLFSSIERGDTKHSSFRFADYEDDWGMNADGTIDRRFTRIGYVLDVSPVTQAAYRSSDCWIEKGR